MKRSSFLCILIFLFAGLQLKAQNPYIQHYTTFDGLPSNMIYHVFQDSHKFIWFATDAGVVRYDGSEYTNFQKSNGLSSNEIVRIMEDSRGRIWFTNLNGKFNYFYNNIIYNEENAPFLKSLIGKGLFRNSFEDTDKTIYFYHNYNTDIFALDSMNRVTKYSLPSKLISFWGSEHFEGMVIRYISKNSAGEFLVWTIVGIYKCKKLTDKLKLVSDTFEIMRVIQSGPNSCYVNGGPGAPRPGKKFPLCLYHYIGDSLTQTMYLPIISDMPVSSVLLDHMGYLWVASFDNGVFCFRDNKVVQHLDIKQALSVIQDHENNIWISSMKEGVYKISPYINKNTHFSNSLFNNLSLSALTASPSGGIWCTNGHLLYLLKNNVFFLLDLKNKDNFFNELYQTHDNILIVGEKSADYYAVFKPKPNVTTNGINFSRINLSPSHYKRVIVNNTEDEICTFDQLGFDICSPDKIFKKDKRKVTVGERIYNVFYNIRNELIINADKNYIYKKDSLMVAGNLTRFNGKIITDHLILNQSTELYNVEGDSIYLETNKRIFNLSANFTYPIDVQIKRMIYHEPTLYLATARNIYVCDHPMNAVKNNAVFLQPIDISFRNINDIIFEDGSLYIASDDGLSVIPATSFRDIKSFTPIPYFWSIQVNDKELKSSGREIFVVGNSNIKFQFGGINYSGEPLIYSYKLYGADTSWTTGRATNVVYLNLPSGNYKFKLKVRKPTSGWSNPIEISIRIKASFWRQPLFYILLLIILAVLISLLIVRRKNLQIQKREIDHQLITLEQQALQAMMNPHFIFNALGSIQNYLLQKRSAEAGLYLSQFARLIRQNLTAINSAAINLEDEIDRLKNYLDLEKLRMENKFDYVIEISETVEEDTVFIPSMIIQPFVENSIWHGISALVDRGLINIQFTMQTEKSLKITIEDNGIGMVQAKEYASKNEDHLKIGIGMTRKRLDILGKKYNVETKIEFSEKSPGAANPGTRVVIVMPVTFGA